MLGDSKELRAREVGVKKLIANALLGISLTAMLSTSCFAANLNEYRVSQKALRRGRWAESAELAE